VRVILTASSGRSSSPATPGAGRGRGLTYAGFNSVNDAGNTIYTEVTPQYSGDNPIPTSIDMMAVTSEGVPIVNSDMPNVPNTP